MLTSKLDTRSDDYKINAEVMRRLVADLKATVAKVMLGGGEAARAKHVARGKLLPRERVQSLLDPGTPFLELSQLAAHGMYVEKKWLGCRTVRRPDYRYWPYLWSGMHDCV